MGSLSAIHKTCTDCGAVMVGADAVVLRHCAQATSARGCPWCADCFAAAVRGLRIRRPGAER